MNTDPPKPPPPWWRVPALWLVIGGPALVVVASFVTLAIAWHGADPPVRAGAPAASADTMTPAKDARNHVATPSR
ncbi:MAG TPA: nitrogen fixation protein FixH [Burkholderiaceae bacterium]